MAIPYHWRPEQAAAGTNGHATGAGIRGHARNGAEGSAGDGTSRCQPPGPDIEISTRITADPAIVSDSRFPGEVGQHLIGMLPSRSDLLMEVRQSLEHETRIGEILIHEGAMDPSEVEAVLFRQKYQPGRMKFGEILLKEKRVEASDVIRAIRMQKIRSAIPDGQTVKIPLERMDQLVQPLVELAAMMVDLSVETEEDRGLGVIEVVAFQKGNATHIDITGDSSTDMESIRRHPTFDLVMRRISQIGGRLRIDDMMGTGVRACLFFSAREARS